MITWDRSETAPFLFHNVICVLMSFFSLLLHDSVGTQEAKKEHENTNDIMERKAAASQKKYEEATQERAKEKRRHEARKEKYKLLERKYTALQHDMEVLTMKMEEEETTLEADAFNIRHTEQR